MRDGEELTILDTSAWRSMNRGRTTFLLRNNCMLEFLPFFRKNSTEKLQISPDPTEESLPPRDFCALE